MMHFCVAKIYYAFFSFSLGQMATILYLQGQTIHIQSQYHFHTHLHVILLFIAIYVTTVTNQILTIFLGKEDTNMDGTIVAFSAFTSF